MSTFVSLLLLMVAIVVLKGYSNNLGPQKEAGLIKAADAKILVFSMGQAPKMLSVTFVIMASAYNFLSSTLMTSSKLSFC